ncbi:TB2/DP1, HVA22 family protein [Nitzschia inconspicua]|uniref:TB2/DP1, HVA22 family protein n=1 Tax=Nitzschia inconspicua TaxID=303405 RepID=A0A9K3KU43_9STRA|nr:TB2/DP1, HVA22 family protein [Nitzschia inconspicua]
MVLQFLKPIVILWAGLSALDDVSSVMKIMRLVGSSLSPFRQDESQNSMCDLCDDIVAGLMAGSEGLQAVPCSWLCLRVPKCMRLCETVKETAANSTKYPCITAGYCTDEFADEDDVYGITLTQMECAKGPLWSCEPRKYCRRHRQGWKWKCSPKPGIGRWVGMQKAAARQTAALAAGFVQRKHCGEPDAGPFCIASPTGTGKIAEMVGAILSLFYGGYHSIVAIETPGGDDDQQWLTFWIILVGSMFLERAVMQVLLSKFPFYYEIKLLLLIWLMFFGGATYVYRRLRRKLANLSPFFESLLNQRSNETAQLQLDILADIGGDIIAKQVRSQERNATKNPGRRSSAVVIKRLDTNDKTSWEYDYIEIPRNDPNSAAAEQLYVLSKWLLSSEGLQEMEESNMSRETIAMLLERAAALISFHPKYLNIHLIGTKPGREGDLPAVDRNGNVDCYVKFYIRASQGASNEREVVRPIKSHLAGQGVKSSTVYNKRSPVWNEKMELLLRGGAIGFDGTYRDEYTKDAFVVAEAWDADVGIWGIGLEFFQISFLLTTIFLFVGHVRGNLDSLLDAVTTRDRAWLETCILSVVAINFVGLTACYLMSVILRADDTFIGSCEVPLNLMLDQREHALCLRLQNAKNSARQGILRVRFSLSE